MLLFVLNDKKLSNIVAQISENIYLGNNKGDNNDNSSPQTSRVQNSLLISIVDTPEKDLSKVEGKSDRSKVRTCLVKSSPTLF